MPLEGRRVSSSSAVTAALVLYFAIFIFCAARRFVWAATDKSWNLIESEFLFTVGFTTAIEANDVQSTTFNVSESIFFAFYGRFFLRVYFVDELHVPATAISAPVGQRFSLVWFFFLSFFISLSLFFYPPLILLSASVRNVNNPTMGPSEWGSEKKIAFFSRYGLVC